MISFITINRGMKHLRLAKAGLPSLPEYFPDFWPTWYNYAKINNEEGGHACPPQSRV